jgi:hypothetical protein
MEQGFLLDGIDGFGNRLPVDQAIQGTAPVLPNSTDTRPTVLYGATMETEVALNHGRLLLFVEHGFFHRPIPSMPHPNAVSPFVKTSERDRCSIHAYPGT